MCSNEISHVGQGAAYPGHDVESSFCDAKNGVLVLLLVTTTRDERVAGIVPWEMSSLALFRLALAFSSLPFKHQRHMHIACTDLPPLGELSAKWLNPCVFPFS